MEKVSGSLRSALEGCLWDYGERSKRSNAPNVKFEISVQCGRPAAGARALSDRESREKPILVRNSPKAIKAFYMRVNDDGRTVAAMEVLAPGIGETIGGSQREERPDRNMAERGQSSGARGDRACKSAGCCRAIAVP
jgi:asparaginyl-tRNA synthetase